PHRGERARPIAREAHVSAGRVRAVARDLHADAAAALRRSARRLAASQAEFPPTRRAGSSGRGHRTLLGRDRRPPGGALQVPRGRARRASAARLAPAREMTREKSCLTPSLRKLVSDTLFRKIRA